MPTSLRDKSISAVFWSGIDSLSGQGIQFVVSVILARLLTPHEFGIMAMLSLVTALAAIFIDSGFGAALIQKKEISQLELSSVFYFNIAAAIAISLTLCAAAPWIANYFNAPVLRSLIYISAACTVFGSFGSVHSILLDKTLNFRTKARINLATKLISSIAVVGMAANGYGVWSLAAQGPISGLVGLFLIWTWYTWRPSLTFSLRSLRSLFGFSSFLLFSTLLDTAYTRLYIILIGKSYSATDLGTYSRADNTQQLPASVLTNIVKRVAFPLFSTAANDVPLLVRGVRKSQTLLMCLNTPIMLGLVATSEPLILTLFGSKWVACIPYLQVLALAGVFWPIHVINLSVLTALGHSQLFFRLEVAKKVIGLVILLTATQISMMAIAWSQLVISVVCLFINAHYTGVFLRYPLRRQLLDISPYLATASLMAISVWGMSLILILPAIIKLALLCTIGIALYFGICKALKFEAPAEILEMIRSRFRQVTRPPVPQS